MRIVCTGSHNVSAARRKTRAIWCKKRFSMPIAGCPIFAERLNCRPGCIASHRAVCLAMRRRRKGEPERELSLEEFIPTSDGELRLQIPADGLSPEQALENKQLRRALRQAIQKLPAKYRVVLVLRDMEELSAKEVGAVVGLNERAVKSRLHRARLFVRRELSARGIAMHGE